MDLDYFASVETQLQVAMRRRASRGWRARLRSRNGRLVAALCLCAVTAGSALAASGVIPLGSAVRIPPSLSPRAGAGIPAPGGVRLLPLRYADPEGGPPWGMRVIRTTRGLVCVQVARVQDGRLGQLGIDGAFHDDGRFHPLPAAALPDAGGSEHVWEAAPAASCFLPTQPFVAQALGVPRGAASGLHGTRPARSRLRNLYFGLLGPDAVSVRFAGVTQPVVPGVGAYLFVRATGAHDQAGAGGASMGTFGALAPSPPITTITYRLHGSLCERVLPGHVAARPCPAPQTLYGPQAQPAPALHVPVTARLRISAHHVLAASVAFAAPFAVSQAGEGYEVRVPQRPCAGMARGYEGVSTDRDIARGQLVVRRLLNPFGAACSRTIELQLIYVKAGYPARPVGSAVVAEPPGTTALPVPRFPRRRRPPAR